MFAFSGSAEHSQLYKVLQISGGGGSGCFRNRQIIFCTEPALEPFQPFSKHPREHLVLSRIELATQAVIEFGFLDEEIDESLRVALRLQHCLREIDQPVGDLQILVVVF